MGTRDKGTWGLGVGTDKGTTDKGTWGLGIGTDKGTWGLEHGDWG